MQFSALRYFLETARLGSIRRAAERLYVAPSAISRQIALLEQDFGMPLFERHASGVRLTEAGEVFARQARTTVQDFERLRSEIDDFQQLRRGTVRIVSVWGTVADIVFPAIAEFTREHSGIVFDVQVINGGRVMAALATEECDIGIGFEAEPHPDIEVIQSLSDPIVAVMNPQHPLASHISLAPGELADHPIAMLDEETVTRFLMDKVLAAEGLSLRTPLTYNRVGLAAACAHASQLVTFAPRSVVQAEVKAGLVVAVIIEHPLLQASRFVLCRHRSRRPTVPARAFMAALQQKFAAHDLTYGERHVLPYRQRRPRNSPLPATPQGEV